jgi:hypothetical protein
MLYVSKSRTIALLVSLLPQVTIIMDHLCIGMAAMVQGFAESAVAGMHWRDRCVPSRQAQPGGILSSVIDLQWHAGRLFPNNAVDCAGRVVFSKKLESNVDNYRKDGNSNNNGGGGNWALTMIMLSKNGPILLLRHRLLWHSMLHLTFVASKLQVYKSAGHWRLMEVLMRMGFSFD